MKPFYVYILQCSDNSYYIGHTDDLEQRMFEHMRKQFSGYTSIRLPVKLKFMKEFNSRNEAFSFERQIKKWSRKKKEALITGNLQILRTLAKRRSLT